MNAESDVLIVGGGLVGLALAVRLRQLSYQVKVLESASPFAEPTERGLRVSAISPASQQLLEQIGAWNAVPVSARCPFTRMRVWDHTATPFGDRSLEFAGADCGVHPLGHIVHNSALQWSLYQAAKQAGVAFAFDAAVDDLMIEPSGVRVFCEGDQHTARLLVGADGGRSRIRELADIDVFLKSYGQRGLVCNVEGDKAHEQTAWQRFGPSGVLAFLPLDTGECSIVWSLDEAQAADMQALSDADLAAALERASDGVFGALRVTSSRATFPLHLLQARSYTAERLALIGDAAHVIHPLAGQGVNLGFSDVAELGDVLVAGGARGDVVGDRLALRKYERARKYQNRKMQLTVDALQRLFATPQGWAEQGRSLGMGLLNQWPTMKSRIAREALGTR